MKDIYVVCPDSPASSCSSVSEMSVSPAPSPASPPDEMEDSETEGGRPRRRQQRPRTDTEDNARRRSGDSCSSSGGDWWPVSPPVEDNRRSYTGAVINYPPNPYRRHDPYRVSRRERRGAAAPPSGGQPRPDPAAQRRFQAAASAGDCLQVSEILARGHKVNLDQLDEQGWTALHWGVQRGQLELVKTLVSYGADPRLASRDGFSPLHMASWFGYSNIAGYLLSLQR